MNDHHNSGASSRARPLVRRIGLDSRRRFWLTTGLVVLAQVASLGAIRPAQAAAPDPNGFVESLTNTVLDQLKNDPAVQKGDQARISEIVDQRIMPNVDFERMTALSVGRGWRDATAEQKTELSREFRTLLVRTYSGAFSAVRDQTVRMRPFRGDAATDKEVVVRSEIVQTRGEPIQIDYRMSRAPDTWKIFDVNVMGVWLVQTYRNQFAQEIANGGIDGLIKSLVEKNKANAPAARS